MFSTGTSLAVLAGALLLAMGAGIDPARDSLATSDKQEQAMSAQPTDQMQKVLDKLEVLGVKPIDTLTVEQARTQPTPADAVKAVLRDAGKSAEPLPVGKVENRKIAGPGGDIPIRIYWPQASNDRSGTPPVVLYIHGGGWVIANLDVYDASPRALVDATGAIVVSTHYRQAPEHKFPAAHNDTWAAWQWTLGNAASLGGDPERIAVVGESAGGNMAAAIALRARDENVQQPVHQVLVYPVADAAVGTTESERNNREAAPLNTAALPWFYDKYLHNDADGKHQYFSILDADLKGVAPATIITAEIDPLRSEGVDFAKRLEAAGVAVQSRTYRGVTHEFFGMGAVLDEAKDAVELAAVGLTQDFVPARRQASTPAGAAH